jgi:hypothetical protein
MDHMRWQKHFGLFVFVAWLVMSVPLHATPIVWQLTGATFSDGATASGTFSYDATLDLYSAWNIVVTPGIFTAYDYTPGVDGGFVGIHPPGQVDFVAFPPATSGRFVRLAFSSALTGAGGTDLLRTDLSGYECDNCSIQRYITGGAVTSVPEPSNLTLVPAALAIAGLFKRGTVRAARLAEPNITKRDQNRHFKAT